jgi:hypothetical protein
MIADLPKFVDPKRPRAILTLSALARHPSHRTL